MTILWSDVHRAVACASGRLALLAVFSGHVVNEYLRLGNIGHERLVQHNAQQIDIPATFRDSVAFRTARGKT